MFHQVNCGCEQYHHGAQVPTGHHGHCCCGHNLLSQRFPTQQEIKEELTEYLRQLKAEAKGVEEKLAELAAES